VDDSFKNLSGDVRQTQLAEMETFHGKKLMWSGWDEEMECFCLVFEDFSTISVEEISTIPDGRRVAQSYIEKNLKQAQQTLALKDMLEKNTAQIPLELPYSGEEPSEKELVGTVDATALRKSGTNDLLGIPAGQLPDFGEAAQKVVFARDVEYPLDTPIEEIPVISHVPPNHDPMIPQPQGDPNVPQGTG
jgi:hypothetical protein